MEKLKTTENKEQFIIISYSVIEYGAYKDFIIEGLPLFLVGKKNSGYPKFDVAGDKFLEVAIQPKLDKRVDAKILAERLYRHCRNNPTGIYGYKYYL